MRIITTNQFSVGADPPDGAGFAIGAGQFAVPSDVIFGYVVAGVLHWRQQRDRYLVEYTAGACAGFRLLTIGMSVNGRFQFKMVSP
jgi:hypothetical protein